MTPWKKIVGWASVGTVSLLIILLAAGFLLVRSRFFHRYLLAKIIEKTHQATGARVEVGDYALTPSTLRADLYRVSLHGSESDPTRPLLAVDHLAVGLKIVSLLGRKMSLDEIEIDHPVVHLHVDKAGHSNIPQPPVQNKQSKPVDIFKLAIKHFLLNRGEIYCNDQQLPLDAELHDLDARIQFSSLKSEYDGSLNYRRGRIQFSDFNPIQHDLKATFNAAASGFELERLVLSTGASRISARARLTDYSNPAVQGTYQGILSVQELRNILKQPSLPVGLVAVTGAMRYTNVTSKAFMDTLWVDGRLSSDTLALRTPAAAAELRAVRAHYRLENGKLEANNFEADLLGGRLTGNLTMRNLAGNSQSRLVASIHSISLNAVKGAVPTMHLEREPLSGSVDADAEATWHGSMQGLRLRSDATIAATAAVTPSVPNAGAQSIPVNAAVHMTYDAVQNVISLNQTYVRTPQSEVRLSGTASQRSSLDVEATTHDLHELDLLGAALRGTAAGRRAADATPPQVAGLYGSASLQGQMQGPINNLRFAGQLTASDVTFRGTSINSLRTGLGWSSSEIAIQHAEIQTGAQGRIQVDANVGLKNWSYRPSNPISVQLSSSPLPLGELERLAKLNYPISGSLTANISLHGSQLSPAGQGSIQLTQARAWTEPIQSLAIQFQGTGTAVHSVLSLRSAAGSAQGRLVYYPRNESYEAQLDAPAISLDQIQSLSAHDLGIRGRLSLSGHGQGTLKAPQLELTAHVPELEIREQKISAVAALLKVANRRAEITLNTKVAESYVEASGSVSLVSDYYATANLEAHGLPLVPLLANYLPEYSEDLHGEAEINASLAGPLKDPARVEAHVVIPKLSLGYQSIEIANTSPIHVNYRSGVLALDRTEIKGTHTQLQLQGEIPFDRTRPVNVSAQGTVNLQIIQMLSPEMDSSGQLTLDVTARGTRACPEVQGQARITNAAFQVPGSPLGVEKINGEFAINNTRLEITQFTAESGGGRLTAGGFMAYQPQVQFGFGLTATGVRLRYPRGLRALLNGQLGLNGTPQSALLNGQVRINRLSFTQEFDLSTFANQFAGESAPQPDQGFRQNVKLDVALRSAQELTATSAKLSLQGAADMHVRGTIAEPVIVGRASLTGGEVFFLGRRYEVQNGVVDFANPVHTEPVVNLTVTAAVNQYNLGLHFVGPLDRLRTTYTSDPPLPPVDVINLLAFGKTAEQSAASGGTPASLGAQSVLAQGLSSQVSGRIEKFVGISHLSIDPTLGGNQRNAGARLALQQRVTKNLLFTFETDVTTSTRQVVQLQYQMSQGWSVSLTRDESGSYAVDLRRHKNF